ncbi:hypothetical protein HBB16_04970 [Pseudonocardia sp. MCCB 268]|nr:hypothetical protein [Pseudonocardia cytotoxica]
MSTLGHTGRKYPSEDDSYTQALEREPDASAERRMELRTEAARPPGYNVAFLTPRSACRSRSRSCTPRSRRREVAAQQCGRRGDRRRVG